MLSESEQGGLQSACDRLIETHRTLLLATRSQAGNAEISYAPYLRQDTIFYIFVSELAKHTENLLTHPQASVLFIEAESECKQLFARQRLSFDCRVQEILKSDPGYAGVMDAMTEKFGEMVSLLRELPDFHLMALMPNVGQFVAGFGKTYVVDATGQIKWKGLLG